VTQEEARIVVLDQRTKNNGKPTGTVSKDKDKESTKIEATRIGSTGKKTTRITRRSQRKIGPDPDKKTTPKTIEL
jgi:hypothetical protein